MSDFVNDDIEAYNPNMTDEYAADEGNNFEGLPNPKQEDDEPPVEMPEQITTQEPVREIKQKQPKQNISSSFEKEKKSTGKLEIDITNVNELISELSYAAKEIEQAIDRVQKNKDLPKIINKINDIELGNFKKIEQVYNEIEKNIDTEKIDRIIQNKVTEGITKLNRSIDQNIKKVQKETIKISDTYKEYSEKLNDTDAVEAFENIEKIQKFTKNFKFKSILAASILGAAISAIAVFAGYGAYLNVQKQQEVNNYKRELSKQMNDIQNLFKNKKVTIYSNGETAQIQFMDGTKASAFASQDGKSVLQFGLK